MLSSKPRKAAGLWTSTLPIITLETKSGAESRRVSFFCYDSPGETQAENFIKTVSVTENMLSPVIDIMF